MDPLRATVTALRSRIAAEAAHRGWGLIRYPGHLLIALVMVLAALGPSELVSANSYNCSNHPTYTNCYGVATFAANPSTGVVTGVNSEVSITSLYDNQDDAHILNEVWTIDNHVYPNPPHGAYVEDGYIGRHGTENYFWGNWRPQDNQYGLFVVSQVPAGDYNTYVYFEVQQDSATQWHMIISSNNYFLDTYSVNNAMTGKIDQIGLELTGTTGASAGQADFIDNNYAEAGGVHYPWDTYSGVVQDGPPTSGWNITPQQSSTGGDWYTACYSNGGLC